MVIVHRNPSCGSTPRVRKKARPGQQGDPENGYIAMRIARLDSHAAVIEDTRRKEHQHQQRVEWSRQHAGLKKHGWLLERDLAKFHGTSSDVQQVTWTTIQRTLKLHIAEYRHHSTDNRVVVRCTVMLFTLQCGMRYLVDSVLNNSCVCGILSMTSLCCCDGGSPLFDCND